MKTIRRKTLLYKTGVEYGDYAINHVLACRLHGIEGVIKEYVNRQLSKPNTTNIGETNE